LIVFGLAGPPKLPSAPRRRCRHGAAHLGLVGQKTACPTRPRMITYRCIRCAISLRMSGGRACQSLNSPVPSARYGITIRCRRCWWPLVLLGLVPSCGRDLFSRGAPVRLPPGDLGLFRFWWGLPRCRRLHRFLLDFVDTAAANLPSPRRGLVSRRNFWASFCLVSIAGRINDDWVLIDPLS
jgi:hypothetical protein